MNPGVSFLPFFLFGGFLCTCNIRCHGRNSTCINGSDFPGYDSSANARSRSGRLRSRDRQSILPSGPINLPTHVGNNNRSQELIYLCRCVNNFSNNVTTGSTRNSTRVTGNGGQNVVSTITRGNCSINEITTRYLSILRLSIQRRISMYLNST